MSKREFDCKAEIVRRFKFSAFATVTFKQERRLHGGCVARIDRRNAEETCSVIRDRVFKKLKCEFRWLTSIENSGGDKKVHAHMAIDVPSHISFERFQSVFLDICGRMDWVNERYEVVQIVDRDGECGNRKVIFYILKEGVDALALSASMFQVRSAGR